jgi:Beta-galactosidase trimerisation domain
VPWHLVGKQETCAALRQYVERGGTLILEAAFGLFDERFYYNDVIPPHGLRDVFGYREKQNSLVRAEAPTDAVSPSERIYYQPEITFSDPVEVRVQAHTFLTPLDVTSATTIATYEGMPVAVKKKVGKGQVFYFGTNLGASIAAGDAGAMKLLRAIVTSVVKPEVSAAVVRPRLLRGAGKSLLMVFNDTPKDQSDRIQLPPGFRKATDLHSGKEVDLEPGGLRATVPYQDVLVLRLT